MSKVPWWGDGKAPYAWTTVRIGGLAMPGKAVVDASVARQVKTDLEPGKDGYTMTHLGYEGAKAEVTLTMWTPAHLTTFLALAKQLRPYKGEKDPQPVDVYHPALEAIGVRSLFLLKLGAPKPTADGEIWEAKIEFLEYIPEAKRKAKASKAKAKAGKGGVQGASMPYTGQAAIAPSSAVPNP